MNALKAGLARMLLRLCSLLPLEFARALGRCCGRLYWSAGGRSRRVTLRNIETAFPGLPAAGQTQLARRSLCASAELIAEMGHVWLRPWSHVGTLLQEVHGAQLVTDAQAAGRGVVVLVPHLGNWEVVGLHLATLGNTVSLYEPPKLAGLGTLIERARQNTGARLVPTDSAGLSRLFRCLKAGGIAGILPDQVPRDPGSGQNAPFMGQSCFTGTLASKMIQRSGALAVFAVAERVRGGFVLRYSAADEAVYARDMDQALAALNRGVEACLQRCPQQYQWEYKRFRQRPRTGPGLYDDLT